MKKNYVLFFLTVALTVLGGGCGANITVYENTIIQDRGFGSTRRLQLGDTEGPLFINEICTDDGIETYEFQANNSAEIDMPDIVRLDYHLPAFKRNRYMVAAGKLSSQSIYPVIFDTGANLDAIILQDIHIRENDMATYPLSKSVGPECKMSLCAIDELSLGDFSIRNYPAICWGSHVEVKFLGIFPVSRSEQICFPLPLMRKFKYFKFDNPAKQIEFSARKSFTPETGQKWHKLPLYYGYSGKNNHRQILYTELEVNGNLLRPLFDTGAGLGLVMNRDLWNSVKTDFNEISRKQEKLILPYHFNDNTPTCTNFTVEKLEIAGLGMRNAELLVLPETKSWKKCNSLLGMGYFADRVVVVDFEKSILWVKDKI
mgnify:CR=1 FL=1